MGASSDYFFGFSAFLRNWSKLTLSSQTISVMRQSGFSSNRIDPAHARVYATYSSNRSTISVRLLNQIGLK